MPTAKQYEEMFKKGARADKAIKWAAQKGEFVNRCVQLPKGKKFFQLKPGHYLIDVIPYITKNNPAADPGFPHYLRLYWRHNNLGPDNKESYPCMLKTFGKPCYVCDYVEKHGATMDKKWKDDIKARPRYLWNLIDLNDRESGIQVFDNAPFKGLGDQVKELLEKKKQYAEFDCPVNGYSLSFVVKEEPMGNGGTMKAVGRVDVEKRDKPYKYSIVEEAACLDDCLLQVSYEEMKRAMGHGPQSEEEDLSRPVNDAHLNNGRDEDDEDSDDEDEKPGRGRSKAEDDEETEDDGNEISSGDVVIHKKYGKCTVIKVRTDGTLRLEDEDENLHDEVRPAAVTLFEEDDEDSEEVPAPKKRGRPKKVVDPDDDDESSGRDEDEDESRGKKKSREEEDDDDEVPQKRTRRK